MKKFWFIALVAAFSLNGMAQNTWEMTEEERQALKEKQELQQRKQKEKQERKQNKSAQVAAVSEVEAKYAQGAVPVVDGKVVFESTVMCPGKSKKQIMDLATEFLQETADEPNQIVYENGGKISKVAFSDEKDGVVSGRYYEHLVFTNKALSLDQTDFDYTLIVKCTDGKAVITMSRIRYVYEANRPEIGWNEPAEEIITDENAFTKKGTKLNRAYGKFRRKTIDRKNYLFTQFEKKLK